MSALQEIKKSLQSRANRKRAKVSAGFFKSGKGQYGDGDIFLGIRVPEQRAIAHANLAVGISDVQKLLKSPIHEYRFTALEILVAQYERGNEKKT